MIPSDIKKKSKLIFDRVMDWEWFKEAEYIHCYISKEENNEVDTYAFLTSCIALGKKVVVPKVVGKGLLEHFQLLSIGRDNDGINTTLGNAISVGRIQLVFVPMVVGDVSKNRLGYGGGYYDRFLSEADSHFLAAGILFDCQMHHRVLPKEDHDYQLDILFTETGTYL